MEGKCFKILGICQVNLLEEFQAQISTFYFLLIINRPSLRVTPSVSKQKLRLDIMYVTKQKVRLVKFLSNFVRRIGMLSETM
jgi:hypothetical protein